MRPLGWGIQSIWVALSRKEAAVTVPLSQVHFLTKWSFSMRSSLPSHPTMQEPRVAFIALTSESRLNLSLIVFT